MSCSALNCANRTSKGFRMFRFPSNPERKKQWLINTKRDKWKPNRNSRLCELHFEQSQFEQKREDGWTKLKPNAVPTVFHKKNSPQESELITSTSFNQISSNNRANIVAVQESVSIDEVLEAPSLEEQNRQLLPENKELKEETALFESKIDAMNETLKRSNEQMQKRIRYLEKKLMEKETILGSFLNKDQIKSLSQTQTLVFSNYIS